MKNNNTNEDFLELSFILVVLCITLYFMDFLLNFLYGFNLF